MKASAPTRTLRVEHARRVPAPDSGSAGACLSAVDVMRFLAQSQRSPQEWILPHLDFCSACRCLVAEAVRTDSKASNATLSTLQEGEVLCARYEILALIGRGGMGEVYRARDLLLDETVALKTIVCSSLDDPRAIERLKREVLLARQITHKNVCRILEFGVHARQGDPGIQPLVPFFTMELLRGETLSDVLRRGKLTPAQTLDITLQIIEGLSAIHACDIIHRDLKPDNVFLVPSARAGTRVVVMDLGLAGPIHTTMEQGVRVPRSQVAGTFEYMAPEQLRGEPATKSSDLFALGLVMLEMLTGARSRLGSEMCESSRISFARSLPPRWNGVVARCLQAVPEARYLSLELLRRALAKPRSHRFSILAVGIMSLAATLTVIVLPVLQQERRSDGPVVPSASGVAAMSSRVDKLVPRTVRPNRVAPSNSGSTSRTVDVTVPEASARMRRKRSPPPVQLRDRSDVAQTPVEPAEELPTPSFNSPASRTLLHPDDVIDPYVDVF